jgi:hypothetical protein
MKFKLLILLIFSFLLNKTIAQVPSTACTGVVAPAITNGTHPSVINGFTPAPILTQQTLGLPNTEYLVIKKGVCARDYNGTCDTINGGGDVIIGTDVDGIFYPGDMNRYGITLSAGDTFSIVPFAYDLAQLRNFVNLILTGTITGTPNPCCALFGLDVRTLGFCDSLSNAGITNANQVNNLSDFLTVIESIDRNGNQLSINSILYYLQQFNGFASILGSAGCGSVNSSGKVLCYGTNPNQKYNYVTGNCISNIVGNTTAATSCGNNGSAQVTVTSSGNYTYLWSNGANSQSINNLNPGIYSVTISNSNNACSYFYTVSVAEVVDYSISVSNTNCNRITSITINNNPNLYSYIWSNGATGSSVNNLPSGLNTVTATNSINGCSIYGSINLPQVNNVSVSSSDVYSCANNGNATINIPSPSSYLYVWSNGANGATAYNLSAGIYSVTATNISNGCQIFESVTISSFPGYPSSEICLVSVDSIDGKNKIIWDKIPNQGIQWYKIYKQNSTTSLFDSIGIVHIDSFSVFKDNNSNPSQQSASYRIAAVDSCGYEVLNFNDHTTIHLSANQGVNNNVNLQWNAYVGFNYSNFEIYRSNNSSPYSMIGTVANNSFSFTDLTPPSGTNYYYVAVTNPTPCNPSKSAAILKSVSNILDGQGNPVNSNTNIQNPNDLIKIFPNPSSDFISIQNMTSSPITNIAMYDMLGRELLNKSIYVEDLYSLELPYTASTYFLKIETENGIIAIQKVIRL